jgi:uncharacterized membrane protein
MRAISHFLRATVLGGVLFLMPIVVIIFVLNKAFDFARRALKPVAKIIPDQLVSGATMETTLAVGLIALLCFLAGLFARTLLAQKMMSELESLVLSKVPAYGYLKQAGSSMMGLGEMAEHPVVLTHLGGAWRIGVQTDAAKGLAAVFVPNSPNTFSGSVFFVASSQIRRLDVPLQGL